MNGTEWHEAVGERDGYRCVARTHHKKCNGGYAECHHIIHLPKLVRPARYLVPNGIALSQYCHILAHATHNGNIAQGRLDAAEASVVAATEAFNSQRGKKIIVKRKAFTRKKDGTK